MSDTEKEQREPKSKPASTGRILSSLLTVPTGSASESAVPVTSEGRSTRSSSPVRLPTELTLKVRTQMSRVSTLRTILRAMPVDSSATTQAEAHLWLTQIEEVHKAFQKEHAYFEVTWPAAFINHEYFENDVHTNEAELYITAKTLATSFKEALMVGCSTSSKSTASEETGFRSKLPDITLPTFSGDYSKWPAYRELFNSMILSTERLSNVEKLHYLRGCMEGEPARLIQNLALTGDSLKPSWDLLIDRYENKRLLIQAHLNELFNISTPTSRSAASLTSMITTVSESIKALQALGVYQDLGDHILVHHLSRHLDKLTREQWETSLGASHEYPQFEQLEKFITSRARALERIEATTSQPSSSKTVSTKKTLTVQHGSTQPGPARSTIYSCDCCGTNHFIVSCPKFRELTVANRKKLAIEKWLCFNCLGRHNVRSCKSTMTCKLCSSKHHTMLHESSTTSHISSSEASPSTTKASH